MQHNTISGHYPLGEAVWVIAGIIILFAFGDALVLLALAFAIAAMAAGWLTYRQVERRTERSDSEMAPVTHLRSALTPQHDSNKNSAHASWHGPSAAA
jgi:hypothetical protein